MRGRGSQVFTGARIIDEVQMPRHQTGSTKASVLVFQGCYDILPHPWLKKEICFLIVRAAEIKLSAGWFLLEAPRENPFCASLLASGSC